MSLGCQIVGFDGIPEAVVSGGMIGGLGVLLMEESDPNKSLNLLFRYSSAPLPITRR